jgi:zinc/manganese transport system substrate-binding protein
LITKHTHTMKRFALRFLRPRQGGFLQSSALALGLLTGVAHASDRLPVTASFSILGDIVQVVGASRVDVTTLVGPDQDAHVFEPKPSHAKTILASKLVVINGLGFEPWADKLIQSAGYKGHLLTASAGIKAQQSDPHAWQNPRNVITYVQNIAAALGRLDPPGSSTYQANAKNYVLELEAFDAWAKAQFAAIPAHKRKVITSHDAFGYFASHYGITFLAPQGISTHAAPSAKKVAALIQQIQREEIRAVFVENMNNPKLIAQLSKDAGVTLGESLYADALSKANQPGASYLQMMRHNVTQLVAGMRRN